jgi:hypothetical protein
MSKEKEELPTSWQFLKDRNCQKVRVGWTGVDTVDLYDFAKMHVEAALKEASRTFRGEAKKKILNSYPVEDKIK